MTPSTLRTFLTSTTLVMFAAAAGSVYAQDDADVKELSDRASTFLAGLGKDATGSFETLLSNSALSGTDEMERLTAAAKELPSKYGAFIEAERVEARRIGQDLVLLTFLYKAERFPIVWQFAFYRPKESWAVVSLRFDSKLLDIKLSATP